MTEARYQELLSYLLDDELDDAGAGELADWLRAHPHARADVQRQLLLWELYGQQCRSERSADAFVAACQTRIKAETDGQAFLENFRAHLRPHGTENPARFQHPGATAHWLGQFFTPRWTFAFTVCLFALALLIAWLLPSTNNTPTLALAPGAQVILGRGGLELSASNELVLASGDTLHVAGTNAVILSYGSEPTRVSIFPGSSLKLLDVRHAKRLELRQGKLEATVARQRPLQPMTVLTPTAEARVLGTEFTLAVSTNSARLDVKEGKVRLTRMSEHVNVPAGYYSIAAAGIDLNALPQTGCIFREYWTNLPGTDVEVEFTMQPAFSNHPAGQAWLDRLEITNGSGTDYGDRWRGFLHPPINGQYQFALDATGGAALYLSPNAQPDQGVMVLRNGSIPQTSLGSDSPVSSFVFKAGHHYYIEVLHKVGKGADRLALSWKRPDGEIEIIPGKYLSPFKPKPKEKNP
jgi:hypothetical protein